MSASWTCPSCSTEVVTDRTSHTPADSEMMWIRCRGCDQYLCAHCPQGTCIMCDEPGCLHCGQMVGELFVCAQCKAGVNLLLCEHDHAKAQKVATLEVSEPVEAALQAVTVARDERQRVAAFFELGAALCGLSSSANQQESA